MIVALVASWSDPVSRSVVPNLLSEGEWDQSGLFPERVEGETRFVLASHASSHILADGIDDRIARALGERPDLIVFISVHRSESGRRSLTVHPVGNPGIEAAYGGRPGRLCPASPAWMTGALLGLAREAAGLRFAVSFEATHHGPILATPAFFIEIGSDEAAWSDPEPARALSRALATFRPASGTAMVGVGGGHYAPRFTEMALSQRVTFGHILPSYVLGGLDTEGLVRAVRLSGAEGVVLHRKGMDGDLRRRIEAMAAEAGIPVRRSREFDPRGGSQ